MPASTFFHGTSADHLKSILSKGLRCETGKVWSCSRQEIYLWSPDELAKAGDCDEEWKDDNARGRAFESAQCAMAKAKDCRAIVLEIEIDSDLTAEDDSCENMTGAVCCSVDISPKQIKRVWISEDLGMMRGYFVAMMARMDLNAFEFTATELQIAKLFEKGEFYFDSSDFPLTPYTVRAGKLIEEKQLV